MLINEVIQQVDLSKRAVKYYEEQGLLRVAKDENGYRNYTEENIDTLKEICIYRKLGISIQDIKTLLHSKDKQLLEQIYNDKSHSLQSEQQELDALYSFIQNHDADAVNQLIDYKTIAQALQDMVPGFYGYYFMNHFLPYLQIQITTPEQQQAYKNIIDFWDTADIKIPLFIKCVSYFMYRFTPRASVKQMVSKMENQLQQYLHPTEEQ